MADDKGKKRISGASLRHAFHEIIWPRRRLVLFGLVLILMNRLAGLVLPIATRPLIDDVIATGDLPGLFRLLGAVALAVVVQAATSYTLTMRLSVEAQHLIAELRTQVQRHVLSLPVRVFDNTRSGDLVSRIMEDVRGVRNLVGTGLVQLVGGVITSVAGFAYLLSISPTMTVLTAGASRRPSPSSPPRPSARSGPRFANAARSARRSRAASPSRSAAFASSRAFTP